MDKWLPLLAGCWVAEADRLLQWLGESTSTRLAIRQAKDAVLIWKNQIETDSAYADLPEKSKRKIVKRAKRLSFKDLQRAGTHIPADPAVSLTVQVPSGLDLQEMAGLPAGDSDNQERRLRVIKNTVQSLMAGPQLVETDTVHSAFWMDHLPWEVLFKAIRSGDHALVDRAFQQIPPSDQLLKAMMKVHSQDYLLYVIHRCTALGPGDFAELQDGDPDVRVGQGTFECFVRDVLTTIEQRRRFNISFGLPTHHAYRDKGAGFCIFNKVAVLIAYEQGEFAKTHHVVIGTDVNRDNGLCEILIQGEENYHSTHLDVHDSRVYPWHTADSIGEDWKWPGTPEGETVTWQHANSQYISVDLARPELQRGRDKIVRGESVAARHPAAALLTERLDAILREAALRHERVVLYLPTGWDSHEKETASAGQMTDRERGRFMTMLQSHKARFSDADFTWMNDEMLRLCMKYKGTVARVYWQLEGGYTDKVNVLQAEHLSKSLTHAGLLKAPVTSSSIASTSGTSGTERRCSTRVSKSASSGQGFFGGTGTVTRAKRERSSMRGKDTSVSSGDNKPSTRQRRH